MVSMIDINIFIYIICNEDECVLIYLKSGEVESLCYYEKLRKE